MIIKVRRTERIARARRVQHQIASARVAVARHHAHQLSGNEATIDAMRDSLAMPSGLYPSSAIARSFELQNRLDDAADVIRQSIAVAEREIARLESIRQKQEIAEIAAAKLHRRSEHHATEKLESLYTQSAGYHRARKPAS
ncbi:MAG: hypothetical protein ABL882_05195 [Sphingopyxis sp.]